MIHSAKIVTPSPMRAPHRRTCRVDRASRPIAQIPESRESRREIGLADDSAIGSDARGHVKRPVGCAGRTISEVGSVLTLVRSDLSLLGVRSDPGVLVMRRQTGSGDELSEIGPNGGRRKAQPSRIRRCMVGLRECVRPDHRQVSEIASERRGLFRGRRAAGMKHEIHGLPGEIDGLLPDPIKPSLLLWRSSLAFLGTTREVHVIGT